MKQKNSFIYNENVKLGRLLMVEGENNTTEIYKMKDTKTPIFTLDVPWWDLDNINRAVKKNEKAIDKALNTHIINGIYGKIDTVVADYEELSNTDKKSIKDILRKKFNL